MLVDVKTPKHLQKLREEKQFANNWEVEKNTGVEQEEPFLEKVDQKTVALAETFLTKKMSVNQNHFRYGAFSNSSLEIFDKVLVLETIVSSYTHKIFPSTYLVESSIEFEYETDRNLYLDMCYNHLSLKLQLFKGRLFEALKKSRT